MNNWNLFISRQSFLCGTCCVGSAVPRGSVAPWSAPGSFPAPARGDPRRGKGPGRFASTPHTGAAPSGPALPCPSPRELYPVLNRAGESSKAHCCPKNTPSCRFYRLEMKYPTEEFERVFLRNHLSLIKWQNNILLSQEYLILFTFTWNNFDLKPYYLKKIV